MFNNENTTINPFQAFLESEENTLVMRQEIDYRSLRSNLHTVSLVGRDENASLVIIGPNATDKLLAHVKEEIPAGRRFGEFMIDLAAKTVEKLVERRMNSAIYTVDAVAIAYRQFRKVTSDMSKKDACYDKAKVIKVITSGKFYQITEEDTNEMIRDRNAAKESVIRLINALAEADKHGIYLNIQTYSDFNKINLVVPEGVKIEDGDTIKFVNGSTQNGITAIGWKNLNRDKAVVHVSTDNRGKITYWINQKNTNHFTNTEKLYVSAVALQFAKDCPVKVREVTNFNEEVGADFLSL